MTDKIVVLSACGSAEEAKTLARHLVETRVAACVNVIPEVYSVFHWEGKVDEASEWMLVIKSTRGRLEALKAELRKMHTYSVPEVVAVPIVDGSAEYLEWVDREVGEPTLPVGPHSRE
jgi:periplasmic divalent cation tolerance protein